jgi:4-amino-4-deoxy-L-arabinose transferase-like glycosyltransferase
LLRTPDFYRQLLDDLTSVILTPLGFALLLAGFLDRAWRRHAAWLAAMVILVAALPRKFYEMNYYYMALLPPLCVIAGLGWKLLWERLRPGRIAALGLLLVALILCLRYAVKPAFVTPEEDRAVVAAGKAIQELTAEEEPIVTMHGTGIDLLYYANRAGWAVEPDTPDLPAVLEQCRLQGAQLLVVAGGEAASDGGEAIGGCELVGRGDGYAVWRLREGRAPTATPP